MSNIYIWIQGVTDKSTYLSKNEKKARILISSYFQLVNIIHSRLVLCIKSVIKLVICIKSVIKLK